MWCAISGIPSFFTSGNTPALIGAGVMRQLLFRVFVKPQSAFFQAKTEVPVHALLLPVIEPLHVGARLDEELHLHLLELACAEDEVSRRYLVTKRLSNLRDAEWHFLPRRLLNVEEVDVNALRGLGTKIDNGRRVFDRSHEGLEHEIE